MSLNEEHPQHFEEGDHLNKDFDADHHPHKEQAKHPHPGETEEHHVHGQAHKHEEGYNFNRIPPDWKAAEKHGLSRRVAKEKRVTGTDDEVPEICECCGYNVERELIDICASPKELTNFGSGFPLFYNFLLYCIIILGIMVGLSGIFNLVTNAKGEYCKSDAEVHDPKELEEMCALNWMSRFALPNKINDPDDMRIQNFLSLASVLIIIVVLMIFRRNQRKIDAEVDESILSPADYTLMVQNIPTMINTNYEEELREFFKTQCLPGGKEVVVKKVNLVYDIDEIEELEKEMHHTLEAKKNALKKDINHPVEEFDHKLEKLEEEITETCTKIRNDYKSFAGVAFISVNTEDEKRDVINHSKTKAINRIRDFLQGSKLYKWHGYVEKQGVFFHGYRLIIKEAPEPTDINWETIHNTNFDKFIVRVQTYSVWAGILAFGFGVIFLIKYFQEKYLDSVLEGMGENEEETKKSIDHVFEFAVLMAFLIILFNKFAVGTAIDYLVEYEKISTKTRLHLSFATKLSICLFFNTALISLIIDILIFQNYYHYGGLIFVEQCVVMIDIGFDLVIWIFDPFTAIRNWRRNRAKNQGEKCIMTQKEANTLMEMPGYHISERYADLLKTMWFVFLYGNLLPMATLMFLIYLIIFYWVDKYNLLRRRCVKEAISLELSANMVESLELIIPIYGLGNYLFAVNLFHQVDWCSITIFVIGIVYIILPMKKINEFLFEVGSEDEVVVYGDAEADFETDYDRENPITKHHSMERWKALKQALFKKMIMKTTHAENNE